MNGCFSLAVTESMSPVSSPETIQLSEEEAEQLAEELKQQLRQGERLAGTSETLTLPQLLLQLFSQLLGFLFAQLNRFRAAYGRHRFGHGKAEAAIHYPFLPSLGSPDCTVCCDPIRPFPQPADPGFRRASSRL